MKFNMTGTSRKAVMAGLLGALSVAGVVATAPQAALAVDGDTDAAVDYTAPTYTGWNKDKSRWYDNGVMAAEHAFYDPESDEWYWADADCTIAKDKDVYIPKDETKKNADGTWGDGKWVRVDEQGVMVKGADFTSSGDLYVFDKITGEMYHGEKYLDSSDIWGSDPTSRGGYTWYHFDDITGVMDRDKDVYITSNGGKWCRYDENGAMVYGEDYRKSDVDGQLHWWYFDEFTGAMAKGLTTRYVESAGENKTYYYDETNGWMLYGLQNVNGTPMNFDNVFGWFTGYGGYSGSSSAYSNESVKKILETAESLESKNSGLWYGSTVTVQPHNTQLNLTCDAFTAYVHYLCGIRAWESWGDSGWWNDSSFYAQIKWVKGLGNLKYNINELEPGDIVFYGSSESSLRHAAIYKGNGVIIHSADKTHGITEGPVSDLGDFVAGGSAMAK